jgi:hypothetical protein
MTEWLVLAQNGTGLLGTGLMALPFILDSLKRRDIDQREKKAARGAVERRRDAIVRTARESLLTFTSGQFQAFSLGLALLAVSFTLGIVDALS